MKITKEHVYGFLVGVATVFAVRHVLGVRQLTGSVQTPRQITTAQRSGPQTTQPVGPHMSTQEIREWVEQQQLLRDRGCPSGNIC